MPKTITVKVRPHLTYAPYIATLACQHCGELFKIPESYNLLAQHLRHLSRFANAHIKCEASNAIR